QLEPRAQSVGERRGIFDIAGPYRHLRLIGRSLCLGLALPLPRSPGDGTHRGAGAQLAALFARRGLLLCASAAGARGAVGAAAQGPSGCARDGDLEARHCFARLAPKSPRTIAAMAIGFPIRSSNSVPSV